MLKTMYVSTLHGAGAVAERVGVCAALEKAGETSRLARWARSLFAIYRIDTMIRLDLPWWTFDAIEHTNAFLRDRPNARVFEYGSGASTVWLARRAGSVTSVEHDPSWYELVRKKVDGYGNARLLHVPADSESRTDPTCVSEKPGWKGRSFRAYADAIDGEAGQFDLIVIDGRARPACLRKAVPRLKEDGMILFDNSHRRAYRQAIAEAPLRATRTWGLTACLPYPDETTLLRPT